MTPPQVKVCGLVRLEDARAAGEAGVDYVGAVLVPGTPREVSPARAAELGRAAGRPLVVVTADLDPADAEARAQASGASVIQLHGSETPEAVADLRRRGPWRVWKALRVERAAEARDGAAEYATAVDGVLLDAWHPEEMGGTGRSFHWEEVEGWLGELKGRGQILAMAGGLTPDNVADAVRCMRPDVVDVSSGVESAPGRKDVQRLRAFVRAVREGPDPGDATQSEDHLDRAPVGEELP